jgi:Wzt-like putative exopolysaccharide export protein
VTQAYLAWHEEKSAGRTTPIPQALASIAGLYSVQSLRLDPGETVAQGTTLEISGEVFSPDGRQPVILIGIVRADDTPVYGVSTEMDGVALTAIDAQRYRFALGFPSLDLLPGKYTVRAHALDPEAVRLFDQVECPLTITGDSREQGFVRLAHRWRTFEEPGHVQRC